MLKKQLGRGTVTVVGQSETWWDTKQAWVCVDGALVAWRSQQRKIRAKRKIAMREEIVNLGRQWSPRGMKGKRKEIPVAKKRLIKTDWMLWDDEIFFLSFLFFSSYSNYVVKCRVRHWVGLGSSRAWEVLHTPPFLWTSFVLFTCILKEAIDEENQKPVSQKKKKETGARSPGLQVELLLLLLYST